MRRADRRQDDPVTVDPASGDAPNTTPPSNGLDATPPAGSEKRRAAVAALVDRALAPAMGLCLRVYDPLGDNPDGHQKARMIVTDCIARSAARGVTADDSGTRRVLARVAEAALDGLVGHPGGAQPPGGVDLGRITGTAAADEIAPSGYLRYAVLQDATAPSRRSDRQVAFVVLAAGVSPGDAAVLLGTTTEAVDAALSRIIRRISESEGVDSMAGAQ